MQKNMTKKIITTIIILTTYVSFGQTSDAISTGKIALGLTFSPDYSYRTLISESSFRWLTELRDSTEIPKFGYTTGLSLIYKFKDRILLETGLCLSDKGEKTKIKELDYGETDPTFPTDRITLNYHYYYLDLPIKANYIVLKGNVQIFVSAGLSTNIFLFQRTKIKFEGSDESDASSSFDGMTRLNFAFLLGAGIDYKINKMLNIRAEPIFRHSITPIVNAPIKQYQYSCGVNFGLHYTLK